MQKVIILLLLVLVLPTKAMAQTCSPDGYSVVFVNGVLNDQGTAESNKVALEEKFKILTGRNDVTFRLGYNLSHLAGGGDAYKSIQQVLQKPTATVVEDYDLQTILLRIHPQVTTQKILLVGTHKALFIPTPYTDIFLSTERLKVPLPYTISRRPRVMWRAVADISRLPTTS